jgi:hypothetical protein
METTEANGAATIGDPRFYVPREDIAAKLTQPLTEGYKATIPLWALGHENEPMPQLFLFRDVERMMIHGHVRNCLEIYESGIAGAEFWGGENPDMRDDPNGLPISDNPEVSRFVSMQVNRWWDRGVPKLQKAYPYGWIGCEAMYVQEPDGLAWDDLIDFSPWDTFMLTLEEKPAGIRVKQVQSPGDKHKGEVDLWLATKDVPAKGVWYAHNPRYNQFYGQSQLLGAWRDWRRVATKGAAETVLDGGFYRLGYCAPLIRYPDEDLQTVMNVPGTQMDSQGKPRRPARDMARMMSEQMQAGAGMGMPSKKYPPEMGGDYMWDVQEWRGEFDGSNLIAYVEHLYKQIAKGIGTPIELIEAMEGGSGFSGRNIPVEAFLTKQQQVADAMLMLFVKQILRPLVQWRWPGAMFRVEVRPLLESKRKAQAGGDVGKKPGVDAAMPSPMPGTHQANSHHPVGGANPPPGQADQGSQPLSPTQGAPFSVGSITKAQMLARSILGMGRAA